MITENLVKYEEDVRKKGLGAGFFIVLFSLALGVFGMLYWCRKEENVVMLKNNIDKGLVKLKIKEDDANIDSDSDGLSDKLEKWYGTDPHKKDTDNDGFSDHDEVKNKYNPTGNGEIQK